MGNRTFNTGSLSDVITVDPITLNLGIGGAPTAYKANVAGAVAATNFVLNGATGNTGIYYGHTDRVVLANYTAGGIDFEVNGGSVSMTLFPTGNLFVGTSPTDSGYKLDVSGTGRFSGNLAIGGTLASWISSAKVLQLNNTAALYAPSSEAILSNNVYVNSSDSNIYLTTNYASQYRQVNGQHIFYTAASGTSGSIISFINALQIASTGAATFSSTILATGVTAKSTGNYGGFTSDNSSSATIGGGFYAANSFGSLRGLFGVAGAISGSTDNNICIFAEGGSGMGAIKFFVNGSGTASHMMTSSGNLLIGTTTDAGQKLQVVGTAKVEGAVYRYNGQTLVGGSFTTLANISFASSRTYLIQLVAVNSEALTNYRWFGTLQYNYNANSTAVTPLASQTMEVIMSGGNIQARTTNGQQYTFDWSITQLL